MCSPFPCGRSAEDDDAVPETAAPEDEDAPLPALSDAADDAEDADDLLLSDEDEALPHPARSETLITALRTAAAAILNFFLLILNKPSL